MSFRKKQEKSRKDLKQKRGQYINAVMSSREDWCSSSTPDDVEKPPSSNITENILSTVSQPPTTSTPLASHLQRFLVHNQQQFSQSQDNLFYIPQCKNAYSKNPKHPLLKQSSFHRYLSVTFSDPSKAKPKSKILSGIQVKINF